MSGYRNSMAPASIRRHAAQFNDIFPILDFKEIAICLQGCDFMASEDLLVHPTPQYIQTLFEQIVDSFLGVSTTNIKPALEASANDVENPDLQQEARLSLALQRLLYRFMVDCGIEDFSMLDIIKPEPERLRRLLSAVVNFARFREEHMGDCEDLVQKSEQNANRYQELMAENEELLSKITILEQQSRTNGDKMQQLEEHNADVESELRKLKKIQEQLTLEHGKYKQEKSKLVSKLEDHSFLVIESKKENERLRPYVVKSADMLQKINADMSSSLQSDKESLHMLESRVRGLEISTDSFKIIEQDLQACIKVIEECEAELHKEEDAVRRLGRFQELYEQRKQDGHNLDRKIQQLERQILNSEERVSRAKNQADVKRESAQKKMAELRDRYATLVAERSVKDQDMDKKKAYIEATEAKMADLRHDLENEIKATALESEKLQAHINSYLNDMEQQVAIAV